MASLIRDSGGRKRIQFIDRDGDRKAIRLGKVSQRMAETVLDRVEKLVEASIERAAHSPDLAEWVASLPTVLHARIVRAGLVAPRAEADAAVTRNRSRVGVWSIFRLKDATMQTRVVRKHGPDPLELRQMVNQGVNGYR